MKTEAIIAILISLTVFLTCLSIHYSEVNKDLKIKFKFSERMNRTLKSELVDRQQEINRLKTINTSLKKEISEWQEIKGVSLTAFCPCEKCSEGYENMSCTGEKLVEGRSVATDVNYIPLGSEIIINGNKYVAEDVGGAVKGKYHIDIYFDSHEDVEDFGKQTADVKVKKGK